MWSPRSRHRRILPLSGGSGGGLRPLVRHLFAREQRTVPRPGASFRVTVRKRRGPRIPMTDRHTPSQNTETQEGGLIWPVSKVGLRRLVLTVVRSPPRRRGPPPPHAALRERCGGNRHRHRPGETSPRGRVGLTPKEPGVVRPLAINPPHSPSAVAHRPSPGWWCATTGGSAADPYNI